MSRTRIVHKNSPHELRGDAEELRPIHPSGAALIDQAQIQFVDERSGVERVVSVLFPELLRGNANLLFLCSAKQGEVSEFSGESKA